MFLEGLSFGVPFNELHFTPRIVTSLESMGYIEPTGIQAQAAPPILSGRDVLGLAPTGTGKTAAFIAPIAHLLMKSPRLPGSDRGVRALVIEPTRELAEQVANEAKRIVAGSHLSVGCAYGGVGMKSQATEIASGAAILVATPGRVRDLIEAGQLSLAYTEYLVIDEADRMLDMGFKPQVLSILEHFPEDRRVCMFTATMPADVNHLAERLLNNPVRIEIGEHTRAVDHIQQRLYPVMDHLKVNLLLELIKQRTQGGILIFARTKRRVGWIATALARNTIRTGSIHGDRTQPQRRRTLERFKSGELATIVATDVAARGLHIESVRTVVNYDLPLQPEEYVHRIGRAGHGGAIEHAKIVATGESITLLDPRDETDWKQLCGVVKIRLAAERINGFDYEERPRGDDSRTTPRDSRGPRDARGKSQSNRGSARKLQGSGGSRKDSYKEMQPPKVSGKPKRRHGKSRPVHGKDKPGGGVPRKD